MDGEDRFGGVGVNVINPRVGACFSSFFLPVCAQQLSSVSFGLQSFQSGQHQAMALVGSAIPGEVGLRLLLSPICSNVVIRTACCTVGTVLPIYSTFKSIERNDQEEREKWLVYWAAYGSFSLVEVLSDKLIFWVPFYYHLKFAFLLWLQLPANNGARHLYRMYIRPFLVKHQAKFDRVLNYTSQETAKLLVTYQGEIRFLKALIMTGAQKANQMLKGLALHQPRENDGRQMPRGPRMLVGPSSESDADD